MPCGSVLLCRVRLQDLVRACEKVAQQYHLRIPFRALGIRREGTRYMQLHPCFARTMRLAQVPIGTLLLERYLSVPCAAQSPVCAGCGASLTGAGHEEREQAAEAMVSPAGG